MGRSKKEKARWGGGRQQQQQPWQNDYPQQAEALGSTKATGIMGHQGLRPTTTTISKPSWSPEERKGLGAEGGVQGREEGLQHTWCGLGQPRRVTRPQGAFTWQHPEAGAWGLHKDTHWLHLHRFLSNSVYFHGIKQVSGNSVPLSTWVPV